MIIFDLDGTLADCEDRSHFVDWHKTDYSIPLHKWKPDWKSFYESCDKDKPIEPVMRTFGRYWIGENPAHVEIWSGRCESVRRKTLDWLMINWFIGLFDHEKEILNSILKMRSIGDNTPDDVLKERWLDEHIAGGGKPIEMVFDDRPKVIRMWRRRGIFVFNCCQHDEEF